MSNLLNNLFGEQEEHEGGESQSPASSELPTQHYNTGNMEARTQLSSIGPFQIGIGSSIGMQRDHNEDSLFAMSTIMVSDRVGIPMGLFIVADGMGGHAHGEKASELAVQAMVSSVIPELTSSALGLVMDLGEQQLRDLMSRGIDSAHKSIQENAAG